MSVIWEAKIYGIFNIPYKIACDNLSIRDDSK